MKFVKSHLDNFNKLVGGHLVSTPAILFAEFATGKSILLQQLAYDFLAEGNALWVDTEGGGEAMLHQWIPTFNKRFGIDARVTDDLKEKSSSGTIYVITRRSIVGILKAFGWDVALDLTSTGEKGVGKLNLRVRGTSENIIGDAVMRNNVQYLVVDSFTNPLKLTFVGGRVQFPARADAVNLWINGIQQITDLSPVVAYSTCHESKDPASKWAVAKISGPSVLKYNHKIYLYMNTSRSKSDPGKKELWVVRYFTAAPWSKVAPLQMTDNGYVDREYTEKEMKRKVKRLQKRITDGEADDAEEKEAAKKARRKSRRKKK